MINQIIDAISMKLYETFGYEIYTEFVEQGLNEPCFSIICINPSKEQFLGNRYFNSNKFCIYYFPESAEKRTECYSVADKLMDALEYINVDGNLVRGLNMDSKIIDDVLTFFVDYNVFTLKSTEKTPMNSVEHNTKMGE